MNLEFKKKKLENGLTVIVNKDEKSSLATLNLLYKVGAKHEDEEKTGFAHLFEHLMFEGSKNATCFDCELEKVGGTNNAFTNNDFTNYYMQLPIVNIETGLWLESDRMFNLNLTSEKFEIQRNVVIEEYKQRYLNQPFADAWLHLRPLAYKDHPYKWPTIGKSIEQIEAFTLKDAHSFYDRFYAPKNAILCVSGNFEYSKAFDLVEKWFGDIPNSDVTGKEYEAEKKQIEYRCKLIEDDFPANKVFRVWHMPNRLSEDYYVCDMISDLLSNGKSARFYQNLVQNKGLFTAVDGYISGDIDPGLFIVSGRLSEGVEIESAVQAVDSEIERLKTGDFSDKEMEKVKNKYEASFQLFHQNIANKALSLSYYQLLGNASSINDELKKYRAIDKDRIIDVAKRVFVKENESRLVYKKK